MASHTTYTCDQCGKHIERKPELSQALHISVTSDDGGFTIFKQDGDFCSWPCAVIWLTNQSHR